MRPVQHAMVEQSEADGKANSRVVLSAPIQALHKFLLTHLHTAEAWQAGEYRRR